MKHLHAMDPKAAALTHIHHPGPLPRRPPTPTKEKPCTTAKSGSPRQRPQEGCDANVVVARFGKPKLRFSPGETKLNSSKEKLHNDASKKVNDVHRRRHHWHRPEGRGRAFAPRYSSLREGSHDSPMLTAKHLEVHDQSSTSRREDHGHPSTAPHPRLAHPGPPSWLPVPKASCCTLPTSPPNNKAQPTTEPATEPCWQRTKSEHTTASATAAITSQAAALRHLRSQAHNRGQRTQPTRPRSGPEGPARMAPELRPRHAAR
jgi:hypothetical protein